MRSPPRRWLAPASLLRHALGHWTEPWECPKGRSPSAQSAEADDYV
jgi:hypothetical protein